MAERRFFSTLCSLLAAVILVSGFLLLLQLGLSSDRSVEDPVPPVIEETASIIRVDGFLGARAMSPSQLARVAYTASTPAPEILDRPPASAKLTEGNPQPHEPLKPEVADGSESETTTAGGAAEPAVLAAADAVVPETADIAAQEPYPDADEKSDAAVLAEAPESELIAEPSADDITTADAAAEPAVLIKDTNETEVADVRERLHGNGEKDKDPPDAAVFLSEQHPVAEMGDAAADVSGSIADQRKSREGHVEGSVLDAQLAADENESASEEGRFVRQSDPPPPPLPLVKPRGTRVAAAREVWETSALPEANPSMAPVSETQKRLPSPSVAKQVSKPMALAPSDASPPRKPISSSSYNSAIWSALARHKPRVGRPGSASVTFEIGSNGRLRFAKVSRSSGDSYLDRLAIASVRNAAPFPSPPSGLVSYTIRIYFR